MPIAYVAAATVIEFGGTASVVCNKPAGTADGHVMVAFVWIYDNPAGDVTTPPSGWTLIGACSAAVANIVQRAYIKVAGPSEPSSYTWVISNLDVCGIGIVDYSGVDAATPQDVTATANSGTGANRTATGVTTATDGAVIVVGTSGNTQNITVDPSGMSNRATWSRRNMYDQTISVAGATGDKVATSAADADGWAAALVALRPAAGGGGGAAPLLMLMGVG